MNSNIILLLAIPIAIVCFAFLIRNVRTFTLLVAVGTWFQTALTAWILSPALFSNQSFSFLGSIFYIDRTAAEFMLLTNVVTAAALTHAHVFFAEEQASNTPVRNRYIRQFYALSAIFLIAMMTVFVCNNLGFLWISVEATTLCTAGLVYFSRSKHAIEATWKYFIVCSVGIAFALLGTILIFASSQYASVKGTLFISDLIKLAPLLNLSLFKIGFIFCFLGYGTKAGVFPLHSWLPDAHSEAPSPASAMLSGSLLNCALFAIWRLCQISQASKHFALGSDLAIWGGCITVIAAGFFLIRQHGLKRLWAYSSVENVGLMLIAIGLYSPNLFFLQAANHSLAKVALFLLSGNIVQSNGTKNLKDIRGILTTMPVWGVLLALAAFAVSGVPPFGSFISEWLILTRNIELNKFIPAVIVIIGLALSFIAISIHVARILLGTPKEGVKTGSSFASSLIPALLICGSLILGVTVGPSYLGGIFK